MKHFLIIFILSLKGVGSLAADPSDFKNQMLGANMRACNVQNSECFEVKFAKAEMSQWTELFAFTDYEATLKGPKSTQSFKGHYGYFDFSTNKMLLRNDSLKKEILIDLGTLSKKEFPL